MRTIVYIGTSLDGYIARLDDDIEWLVQFQNDEVQRSYDTFIKRIDAIVIGRGTYEKVLGFPEWPYEKKVFVLSTSIKLVPEKLKEKVTVLLMDPKELLKYLSREGYTNIYVDGGKVIQSFLKEDYIDEMIITRVPILIGKGIPLFGDPGHDVRFDHLQTETYSNGLVKSHYVRKKLQV
jgi:dihydrofolate reductase